MGETLEAEIPFNAVLSKAAADIIFCCISIATRRNFRHVELSYGKSRGIFISAHLHKASSLSHEQANTTGEDHRLLLQGFLFGLTSIGGFCIAFTLDIMATLTVLA